MSIVVVTNAKNAQSLVHWGYQFARAERESLVVLYPTEGREVQEPTEIPLEPDEGDDSAITAIREAISSAIAFGKSIDEAHPNLPQVEPPLVMLKTMKGPELLGLIRAELAEVQASLLIAERTWSKGGEMPLERALFEAGFVNTMIIRCIRFNDETSSRSVNRILVPASGDTHSSVALRLGAHLAHRNGGTLTALYVEPTEFPHAEAVGRSLLEKKLRKSKVPINADHVVLRVVLNDSLHAGISETVQENQDLLIVGAERQSFIRKTFAGTVPERLMTGPEATSVAVIRSARPYLAQIREGVERWFNLTVPQMTRDERIDLFARLQTGSQWGFDFMALIALSTTIAAFGLIQSSAAVVIGAMLVAPLMTPILGMGLSLVQGNAVLLRTSLKAIVLGFILAVSLAVVVGLISPVKSLTPELLARGGPNLIDLGVAFVSGIAAAFAMSRPGLLAALPGVAIAAALVPPIATVGIAMSWGALTVSGRSALLFGTNVVAIALGASFVFYAAGVRRSGKRNWTIYAFLSLFAAMTAMAIPLGGYLWNQAQQASLRSVSTDLRSTLERVMNSASLHGIDIRREPDLQTPGGALIKIYVEGTPTRAVADELVEAAQEHMPGAVRIRLIPVIEARHQ